MTHDIETIVIGAGVVGLAIARSLGQRGHEVIILEAGDTIAGGITARNSEVIHGGIYYRQDSLKARFCVAGKQMLYDYCQSHGVPYDKPGKLIVATSDDEIRTLNDINDKAHAAGVDDLVYLTKADLKRMEPQLNTVAALLSLSTGIVDAHALSLALLGDAENCGARLALKSPVTHGRVLDGGFRLSVGGDDAIDIVCKNLVIAAGLGAQKIARNITGINPDTIPPLYYAKGNYFTLAGKSPFEHLVYPVPVPGGLGTHSTLDLGGQTKFGPDVEWIDNINYDVDVSRQDGFYRAIRRYWPDLPDGALNPGYVGIRPKTRGPNEAAQDFIIQGETDHGVKGLITLYGIESPGLTSSLAIGEYVQEKFC